MTELGIPVFNTPGANANSVKELVLCSLFLVSRGIIQGKYAKKYKCARVPGLEGIGVIFF